MSEVSTTPAMQQYYDIKKEHNDCIIFFRMGDFYEMFGEDAFIAHKVLGINVTSRNKNSKNPEALAGIPYHAKDKYLPVLINAGYKVAIVEQVSDPKLKGIVKREVVRIVTPSTLGLEGDNFDNFVDSTTIISIGFYKEKYGLSIIDFSTNEWKTQEFSSFNDLASNLYKLNPKEVVLDKKLFGDEKIKDILNKKFSLNIFFYEFNGNPSQTLISHFNLKNLDGFGISSLESAIFSSALLLDYLENNQKQKLLNLDTIGMLSVSDYLQIDESTLRSLDILFNFYTQSTELGTLFGVLNKTKTLMGKRLLKETLIKPLINIDEIKSRQSFIEEFLNNRILLDKLRQELSFISDLDAILNRLALQRITPRDLLNLKRSLQAVLEILKLIELKGSDKLKKLIN